jgi:hypothetical protein
MTKRGRKHNLDFAKKKNPQKKILLKKHKHTKNNFWQAPNA